MLKLMDSFRFHSTFKAQTKIHRGAANQKKTPMSREDAKFNVYVFFTRTVVLTQVFWIGYQWLDIPKNPKNFWGKRWKNFCFSVLFPKSNASSTKDIQWLSMRQGILSQDQWGKRILLLTFKETSEIHGQVANQLHTYNLHNINFSLCHKIKDTNLRLCLSCQAAKPLMQMSPEFYLMHFRNFSWSNCNISILWKTDKQEKLPWTHRLCFRVKSTNVTVIWSALHPFWPQQITRCVPVALHARTERFCLTRWDFFTLLGEITQWGVIQFSESVFGILHQKRDGLFSGEGSSCSLIGQIR